MQSLEDYIQKNYDSKAAFAKAIDSTRQNVHLMITRGYQVMDYQGEKYICSKSSNNHFTRRGKVYRRLVKLVTIKELLEAAKKLFPYDDVSLVDKKVVIDSSQGIFEFTHKNYYEAIEAGDI